MELHIHVHIHTPELTEALRTLSLQGAQHMALTSAQAAKLEALKTTIDTAVSGLRTDIQALKDAIAAAGGPDPAVDAAFAQIEARLAPLTALDGENPSVPPVPVDEV